MPKNDLTAQLVRQLGFLRSSCASYDNGCLDEAVRIATTIRVIIYDTKKSPSLLRLLNSANILLESSLKKFDTNIVSASGYLSHIEGKFQVSTDGKDLSTVSVLPWGVEALSCGEPLPATDWWDQVIYVKWNKATYTRGQIVKYAAHKDGGAHVDEMLPDEQYALSNESASYLVCPPVPGSGSEQWSASIHLSILGEVPIGSISIPNIFYADIRQMATEVLNSRELLGLTE